jgi:hypothetical protein
LLQTPSLPIKLTTDARRGCRVPQGGHPKALSSN